ncbi:hypothetical protein UMC2_37131 [[Clostridium] sordellii]|uniref:hypothetical protein n=1 Tax=Paraclostridium sordellii TaxID=1505 RepID=UPI000543CE9C|nr:hypothetical protein [Paeniclostridium sordellii]CEK34502.1 hypothetical protein UMC2_37131 [[Clostridium] sordellii] [Paeniclostridium sordellii]
MIYTSLAIQCIFIAVFLSGVLAKEYQLVIDVLWLLSIISGICIGIYKVFSKSKTKLDFKTKLTIVFSMILLPIYIFGLGLDKM